MIYVHLCKTCERIYLLNGHKTTCPKCSFSLTELQLPYQDYLSMPPSHREAFTNRYCRNDLQIINQDSC